MGIDKMKLMSEDKDLFYVFLLTVADIIAFQLCNIMIFIFFFKILVPVLIA